LCSKYDAYNKSSDSDLSDMRKKAVKEVLGLGGVNSISNHMTTA
jgi:hypothetical protein